MRVTNVVKPLVSAPSISSVTNEILQIMLELRLKLGEKHIACVERTVSSLYSKIKLAHALKCLITPASSNIVTRGGNKCTCSPYACIFYHIVYFHLIEWIGALSLTK